MRGRLCSAYRGEESVEAVVAAGRVLCGLVDGFEVGLLSDGRPDFQVGVGWLDGVFAFIAAAKASRKRRRTLG